jgi:hypothetical protein
LKLLREVIGQQCEAKHDGGDYDAGNQSILEGGNRQAICPQREAQFRVSKHGFRLHIRTNGALYGMGAISGRLQSRFKIGGLSMLLKVVAGGGHRPRWSN